MRLVCLLPLLLLALAAQAGAQAYCALRDPNRQIRELFPESDSYRSIVRTVDEEARREVAARLPFSLHFNELGRHTLYLVQRDGSPIGLVHVRSEAGRYGLVEIAWAFDLDLRVLDFRFQRCRDRGAAVFSAPGVRAGIIGADFDGLRGLLGPKGNTLRSGALPLGADERPLGAVVVRNALKTIATTESAWFDDLLDLRATERARELAPEAVLRPIGELYTGPVLEALGEAIGPEGAGIVRARTRAWEVFDGDGAWLGRLLSTRWRRGEVELDLWWRRAPDGALAAVDVQGAWPDDELAQTFETLQGRVLADLCHCAGAVELAALEVLITSDLPAPSPLAK